MGPVTGLDIVVGSLESIEVAPARVTIRLFGFSRTAIHITSTGRTPNWTRLFRQLGPGHGMVTLGTLRLLMPVAALSSWSIKSLLSGVRVEAVQAEAMVTSAKWSAMLEVVHTLSADSDLAPWDDEIGAVGHALLDVAGQVVGPTVRMIWAAEDPNPPSDDPGEAEPA